MLDRRAFLGRLGLTAATLALPRGVFAQPPFSALDFLRPRPPVRIRGKVTGAGRDLRGVRVSDGIAVTRTDNSGEFDFVSGPEGRFVFLTVPAGFAVPVGPAGTARHFVPIAGGGKETKVRFDLERSEEDGEHGFFLLADPQTLDGEDMGRFRRETIPDIRRTLARESVPHFAVSCGDIMFDDLSLLPEYEKAVEGAGMPFFQVIGNHDVETAARSDDVSARTFEGRFGPSWYSFERGEIHYVVLDDVFWYGDYFGYVDERQLRWLRADLAHVEKGRTVVVFTHIPVYCKSHERRGEEEPHPKASVVNRETLYEILRPYRSYIITGHMHESEYLEDGGTEIHVCGAVCGSWWSDDICRDGTPNGYSLYRARGSALSWRYHATGKSPDHQMRLYKRGSDPGAPEAIVANVWAADKGWKVAWSEDGVRRFPMERRLGRDPRSVLLHGGPNLPAKHPWVEPVMTDHLFYAVPSAGATEVVVEATDRWGRTYREKLPV
ncbi:MAG: calcineurin-like phosphoesterase family protein [Candidatus Eisenbacteria bacterium]